MISLEQVQALESRVEKAVALISSLRSENESLRSGLATAVSRVTELEERIADFQKDQSRIEEGIVEALRKLDFFEDTVHGVTHGPKAPVQAVKPKAPVVTEKPAPDAGSTDGQAPDADTPAQERPTDALDIF